MLVGVVLGQRLPEVAANHDEGDEGDRRGEDERATAGRHKRFNSQLPTPSAQLRGLWELEVGNRELFRFQPLYGINGAAVDADLEVERRRASRCGANAADL